MKTAYKLFDKDLSCRGMKFPVGEWVIEDKANLRNCGLHCADNPLDCLSYYNLSKSRAFIVKIDGDIDEDDSDSAITATKMMLVKELDTAHFVAAAMLYVIRHPQMENNRRICTDKADKESSSYKDGFLMVRGKNPLIDCHGLKKGTVCCLMKEGRSKDIKEYNIFLVGDGVHDNKHTYNVKGKAVS